MSSITIEELKKLPAESYQIIDVRDEIEISHLEITKKIL